jgi:hypothetical protein
MQIMSANRQRVFDELRKAVGERYSMRYRGGAADRVVVVFSPTKQHALSKYQFAADVLHMCDESLQYYLIAPGNQSKHVARFIDECGYDRAIFMGSSKGGFAALLWSALVNSRRRAFGFGCLAFSPQTSLHPRNRNLDVLPSYASLLKSAENNAPLIASLIKYGDLPTGFGAHLPKTRIFYSARNAMDAGEARRLTHIASVECVPIDISFHGAITAFTTDIRDRAALDRLADKIYRSADTDTDLRAQLPADREAFVADFIGCARGDLNAALDVLFAEIRPGE